MTLWIALFLAVAPVFVTPASNETSNLGLSRFTDDLNVISGPLIKHFLPIATQIFSDENISPKCSNEILQYIGALNRREAWAIRITLATGMYPNNMFEGTLANLGGYEQCLKTTSPNGEIVGQYCTLWVQPPEDIIDEIHQIFNKEGFLIGRRSMRQIERDIEGHHFGVRCGLCTSGGCSETDLNHIGTLIASRYGANITIINCRTEATQYRPLGVLEACVIVFIVISLLMVLIATFMDIRQQKTPEELNKKQLQKEINKNSVFVNAFSLAQNLPKAVSTKTPNKDLKFLFGLRTFLALWIVYSHGYVLVQFDTFNPGFAIFDLHNTLHFYFGQGTAFLSVASFFFLSGFMISYMFFKRPPTESYPRFYIQSLIKRYIRLTWPAIVLILYFFLTPLYVAGPLDGDYLSKELKACRTSWWSILLHVQNFFPTDKQCYGEMWYISAEMQSFIFALALTLILAHRPKMAVVISILVVIAGSIASFWVTYSYELLPAVTYAFSAINKLLKTVKYVYHHIYSQSATYLCGLFCGYLTVKYRDARISKRTQCVLWFLSFGLALFVMFINMVWNTKEDFLPNAWIIHGIYAALHKPLWGLSMMWVIYACATGRGGILNRFWSWNFFVPIGKLSYFVFLVHYMIYLIRGGTQNTVFHVSRFIMIKDGLGVWVLSILFSLYLHLVHEAPVNYLERIMFQKLQTRQSVQKNSKEPSKISDSNGKFTLQQPRAANKETSQIVVSL